jgi:hypothetical protein
MMYLNKFTAKKSHTISYKKIAAHALKSNKFNIPSIKELSKISQLSQVS